MKCDIAWHSMSQTTVVRSGYTPASKASREVVNFINKNNTFNLLHLLGAGAMRQLIQTELCLSEEDAELPNPTWWSRTALAQIFASF